MSSKNIYEVTDQKIGEGSNGKVYLGYSSNPSDPTSRFEVAIKKIKDSPSILKEVNMMSSIPPHPNICKFHHTWVTDSGKRIIAMELIKGKDLKEWLDEKDPDEPINSILINQVFLQCFSAIDHLHEHLIAHCDIKPANIMINEDKDGNIEIKLIDFGLSRHFHHIPQKHRGTPLYFSPEIAGIRYMDYTSDIWAMGVILLNMLTGIVCPFFLRDARKVSDVLSLLQTLDFDRTPFPRELLEHYDPGVVILAGIAQRCLSLDKATRPTPKVLVSELLKLSDKLALHDE